MPDKPTHWKATLLVTLVSVAVALGLVELGTRYWLMNVASEDQLRRFGTEAQNRARDTDARYSNFMYSPHRYLAYVLTPRYEKGANRHNKWGYRGGEFSLAKQPGQYRIACVGGSTTYTNVVEDHTKSYPAQLEAVLRQAGLPEVRVINSGVPGWSSYETLINYEFRLVETDPDLIVVYHGINDLIARIVWPPAAYRTDNSGSLLSPSDVRVPPWYERSDFLRTILVSTGQIDSPMSLHQVQGRLPRSNYYWKYRYQFEHGTYPDEQFREHPIEEMLKANPPTNFTRNIEHLVVLAKADGRDIVLVTFKITPQTNMHLNHPAIYAGIDEQNEILKDIGRRHGVPVFDLAEVFPDDPRYYGDGIDAVHVNEEGALLKAQMIAKFLLDHGLANTVKQRTAAKADEPAEPEK